MKIIQPGVLGLSGNLLSPNSKFFLVASAVDKPATTSNNPKLFFS